MRFSIMTIILLLVLSAVFIGIVVLQIFLSKKQSRWLGLIIPIIFFSYSVMTVVSTVAYTTVTEKSSISTDNGVVIEEHITLGETKPVSDILSILVGATSIFAVYNIPTLIFLAIYFSCKKRYKRAVSLRK
ncbi:MAG: hypothetical protein RR444_07825 [Oscillospiraceae bacterium]